MRRVLLALVLALMLPVGALAAFPGGDTTESPRANTPNDPDFDRCEGDNEGGPTCGTYADEEFRAFGFSPDSANQLPAIGGLPHSATGTRYTNCSQLDGLGLRANILAEGGDQQGRCLQIAGVRADQAHKYWTGDPDTAVAILDTGIRWQNAELRTKVRLNRGELPKPNGAAEYDANGDGAFNVDDYSGQVDKAAGDDEADSVLDGSDLIATFSDGKDVDGNGYVDDIAGWDFFDDDNDPFDASSCCSANGHGSGRAAEAVASTNNGQDGIGMCPKCQLMPLRVWDTFVVPTDNYAMGAVYAASNGASVVEGAVGGLTNTQFARRAFEFADSKGVALMLVSSDINSANHNYPTNYNEAIYVAGSLFDTAPNDTCGGLPGLPGVGDLPSPPAEFAAGCKEFLTRTGLGQYIGQPLTTSFFRNSNLTQYGGKADVVLMGSTGSENTGQSAGVAGLLMSYAKHELGTPLNGNEVRQVLTMTAEDVLADNTGVIGNADKAEFGWDTHFGYGRVNLAAAMQRIKDRRVPPQAQLDAPDWYAPIDVDRVPASGVEVRGRALGGHGTPVGDWEVEYACGQAAPDATFKHFSPQIRGTGERAPDSLLGTIPKAALADLADNCNGEVALDAGRPAGTTSSGAWPADPYPDPDPERHTFQIRLTVHAANSAGNIGRYRKTLHAYNDDGNRKGWPLPLGTGSDAAKYRTGSGGEASPRLFDVDGDNRLDTVLATSSGELWAMAPDGTPLQSFNGGRPVLTDRYQLEENHPVPGAVATPHESLRVPAIGDIDGDLEPEIVATAGEHLYAWEMDGTRKGRVGLDRARSEPCKPGVAKPCFHPGDRAITSSNHIKRGFISSPVLADLDPKVPGLEIVAAALDQHVYAWHGDGSLLAGFPAKLASDGADGAEIVTTPAIADLDGQAPPEIVVSTNEVVPGSPDFPGSIFDFASAILQAATGYNPVYALHADGSKVAGWPVKIGVAAGDLLPLVLPGQDAAVINADGGTDEVAVSAGTSVVPGGGARLVDGGGATVSSFETSNGNRVDTGATLNLADYPSAGDVLGTGQPQVLKGGLSINGVVNLLAPNQNLPFNHIEQLWQPATPAGTYADPGTSVPGFPVATDDFQLVSQGAVARVGSPTTPGARQALVGTGLYQLHAYGPGGVEPAGWPKFTGGWTQATPSVGDADADGKLDVTTLTREGWVFQWASNVDACANSNQEWWTYHHDEHSTANYGHDARPPGTPRDLKATRTGGRIELSFVAPGDDWLCGKADKFRVLRGDGSLEHPSQGTAVGGERDVVTAGDKQSLSVDVDDLNGSKRLGIFVRDSSGNWGHLASLGVPAPGQTTTSQDGGSTSGGGGGGNGGGGTITGVAPGAGCNHVIRGTRGADNLRGTKRRDRLYGRAGGDHIRGLRGRDCLFGGRGRDLLNGGGGRDRMVGGPGRDRLVGRGSAIDRLDCGRGRDVAIVDRRDVVRRCEIVRRGRG